MPWTEALGQEMCEALRDAAGTIPKSPGRETRTRRLKKYVSLLLLHSQIKFSCRITRICRPGITQLVWIHAEPTFHFRFTLILPHDNSWILRVSRYPLSTNF